MNAFLILTAVAVTVEVVAAASGFRSNSTFRTPPMGWSTWYAFGPAVNETRILQTADALLSSGLADLGYNYVLIDDNWMAPQRDRYGNLYGDPERFPNGMKSLADKVSSRNGKRKRRGKEQEED